MSLPDDKVEPAHQAREMAALNKYTTLESTDLVARDESRMPEISHVAAAAHPRVYKRRFFGLAQLVLLNVIVSWDVRELG